MTFVFGEKVSPLHQASGNAKPSLSQRIGNSCHQLARTDLPWITLLVLANLFFFGDALFTNKTFFVRDVSFFHYPLKRLVTEAFSHAQWPLWNPYIQLGQPLLANPNAMALYPTQILFQLLPFQIAFDLHFVLHCLVAGVATFYLARALGQSKHSAFLSAGVYNFSGITLSFVNLFNILPVVAFLPLLSLALIKTLRNFSLAKMACASFLLGIFFLLLEPLSSIAVALFLVPFLAGVFFLSPHPKLPWIKAGALIVIIVLSGLLLASAQIIPTLELIDYSGRKGGMQFDIVSFWSYHPISFLQLIFPRFFGEYFRLAGPTAWGNLFFENREPYLLSCYLGFFPLLLAFCGGLFSRNRGIVNLLIGVSLLAALLALGKYGPVYAWLFQHCPPFRYGRYPVKFLFVVNFCLALLIGFGLDRLEELRGQFSFTSKPVNLRLLRLAGFVLALFLFFLSLSSDRVLDKMHLLKVRDGHLSFNFYGQKINSSIISESLRDVQIHLGAFLLFLVLMSRRKVRLKIVRLAVLGLVFFSLFINDFWINPLIQAELYEPAPATSFILGKMRQEGLSRIYAFEPTEVERERTILGQTDSVAWVTLYRKLTLFQFLAAKDHIHYSVFDPIDRLETFASQSVRQELALAQSLEEKLHLLAALNVGFILSAREITTSSLSLEALYQVNSNQPLRIYKVMNKLPRAFLMDDDQLSNPQFTNQEFLEETRASTESNLAKLALTQANGQLQLGSKVQITQYSPNLVEIEAKAERKSLLVLLDAYYPGWSVTVDGHLAPLLCFQGVFRAVKLSVGNHNISFTYAPSSFRYGLALSLMTLLGWIVGLVFNRILTKRVRVLPELHHSSLHRGDQENSPVQSK